MRTDGSPALLGVSVARYASVRYQNLAGSIAYLARLLSLKRDQAFCSGVTMSIVLENGPFSYTIVSVYT